MRKNDVYLHIFQQGDQPMRFRTLAFTAMLVMLWAAAATATPGVVLPELKYEFDPVVDGTQVTHDFAIKNTGDGPLAITQVKTG
jgi:hypothetical protein